jgi:thiosulfate dehydrogenase [quinone] large subunit
MTDKEVLAEELADKEAAAKESSCSSAHATDKLAFIFSSILLRLWLGVRALQTGIEKYAGQKASNSEVEAGGEATGLYAGTTEKTYSLEFYKGVPDAWAGQLQDQPLMLGFMYKLFDKCLGPALILMGLTILLGVGSRISLMAQGLLYVGLTWGLILIGGPQGAAGAAQLGVHIVLIVMALHLIKHDRFVILKKW